VVRIDAVVMMTKPLIVASRAVSGCLGSPGVASGFPAATLCTDPAIGRFFPCPEGDWAEANSTWPMAHRGGWRLIATTDGQKLRDSGIVVKLNDRAQRHWRITSGRAESLSRSLNIRAACRRAALSLEGQRGEGRGTIASPCAGGCKRIQLRAFCVCRKAFTIARL